jgi:hypothetical protein
MQTRLALLCSVILTSMSASPALAQDGGTLVELVRDATERFKDVKIALSEGYTPEPCVSGPNGGAMGIHYVNAEYLADDEIDITRPQALMYEPQPGGGMELVGAEFITFHGPTVLEGHLFHYVGAPNRYGLDPFYQLHVWAWRENPDGTFADFNPTVSCEAQQAGE